MHGFIYFNDAFTNFYYFFELHKIVLTICTRITSKKNAHFVIYIIIIIFVIALNGLVLECLTFKKKT